MTKRLVVYHDYYGCETGCCGHSIELYDDTKFIDSEWVFSHVYKMEPTQADKLEAAKEWAINAWGDDHLKDIDWENGIVIDVERMGEG